MKRRSLMPCGHMPWKDFTFRQPPPRGSTDCLLLVMCVSVCLSIFCLYVCMCVWSFPVNRMSKSISRFGPGRLVPKSLCSCCCCQFSKGPKISKASAAGRRRRRLYVFRSSVRACVRPCVRASVIHVVVSCFRDISSICWRIFAKLLSLVHLRAGMNWLDFGIKRSKFKVTPSRRRHTALDATVECNFF